MFVHAMGKWQIVGRKGGSHQEQVFVTAMENFIFIINKESEIKFASESSRHCVNYIQKLKLRGNFQLLKDLTHFKLETFCAT